ncbi:MAG TPA: hypothetical protein VHD35_00010 [Chitinophagaceae bacterium]|nr:hypothetical protein [Chitinophagaceae bacterium]
MKKYSFCITIFFVAIHYEARISGSSKCLLTLRVTPPDTLIDELRSINLSQYNGQPVDSLINHLPAGYTELRITGWRSLKLAEILYVIYPNNIEVAIHVRQFRYMDPHLVNTSTPKQNWNISLFKKEAITFTVIFNGSTCINGCENEYK